MSKDLLLFTDHDYHEQEKQQQPSRNLHSRLSLENQNIGMLPTKKSKSQISKTIHQVNQSACWAYLFLYKICTCPNQHISNISKYLLQSQYEQLQLSAERNQEIEAKMKGFFDIFSEFGPQLNQKVFQNISLHKYTKTTSFDEFKINFFPTQVTKSLFNQIMKSNDCCYVNIQDVHGIGKSFSIMLYCYLSNIIIKEVILLKNNNQLLPTLFKYQSLRIRKGIYWNINNLKIKNQFNAYQLISKTFKIIMQQCDQDFKFQYKRSIINFNKLLQIKMNEYRSFSDKQIQQKITIYKKSRAITQDFICRLFHEFIVINQCHCNTLYQLVIKITKHLTKFKQIFEEKFNLQQIFGLH